MCVSLAVCAGALCLAVVLLSIQAVNGQNLTWCVCLGVMCEGLLGSIGSNVNEHLRRILPWQSSKPFSSICAHTQARCLMNNDWSTGCRGYSFTKQFPCFHLPLGASLSCWMDPQRDLKVDTDTTCLKLGIWSHRADFNLNLSYLRWLKSKIIQK